MSDCSLSSLCLYLSFRTAVCSEYMQHRASVPAGHLIEVSFEKLERDPLGTLKKIYDRFGWTERYHSLIPKFKAYCEDNNLLNFKKNQHNR